MFSQHLRLDSRFSLGAWVNAPIRNKHYFSSSIGLSINCIHHTGRVKVIPIDLHRTMLQRRPMLEPMPKNMFQGYKEIAPSTSQSNRLPVPFERGFKFTPETSLDDPPLLSLSSSSSTLRRLNRFGSGDGAAVCGFAFEAAMGF